jgi:DNA-binding protein HU-beta
MAANVTVTLNQLAASLAEEHQLTKRAGRALLDDLISLITKHLKKGASESELRGLAFCRLENELLAWGATLQPTRRLKSRPARKSPSGHPRN